MDQVCTPTQKNAPRQLTASHGFHAGRAVTVDWSDEALARTWRTAGVLSLGLGVGLHAFFSWIPGTIFLLTGAWAVAKGSPQWRHRDKITLA